ncbi:hypothetical protein TNCT_331561 [Trichonephila clavata]|uniref:Uncharacterized protein n=1 Tax=Trichonephila clavata TaxID=2740835 RepID=A0A8X6L136_TRICU|nr:hypothetical protein TNCT_331561 [Trichonephila clavata]
MAVFENNNNIIRFYNPFSKIRHVSQLPLKRERYSNDTSSVPSGVPVSPMKNNSLQTLLFLVTMTNLCNQVLLTDFKRKPVISKCSLDTKSSVVTFLLVDEL